MRRSIRLKQLSSKLEKNSDKPVSVINITLDDLDDLSSEESEKSAKAESSRESLKEQVCHSISSDESSIISEHAIPALALSQNSGNLKCPDETVEKISSSIIVEDDIKDHLDVDAKTKSNENVKLRRTSRKSKAASITVEDGIKDHLDVDAKTKSDKNVKLRRTSRKSKVGACVGQNSRQSIYSSRNQNFSQTKVGDPGKQEIMANMIPRLLNSSQETGVMESDSNARNLDPGVLITEEESVGDTGTLDTSCYSKTCHGEDKANKNFNLYHAEPVLANTISRNSMSDAVSLDSNEPSSCHKLDADAAIKGDFVLGSIDVPQTLAICLDTSVAPESVTPLLSTSICSSGIVHGSTDILLLEDQLRLDSHDMVCHGSVLNVKYCDQKVLNLDDHGDSVQSNNEVVHPCPPISQLKFNQSSNVISDSETFPKLPEVTASSKQFSSKDEKDAFAFTETLAGQLGSDPTSSLDSQTHNQSFIATSSKIPIPSAKKPAAISISCSIPFKEHIKAKLLGKASAAAENTASTLNSVNGLNDVQSGRKQIKKVYSNKLHSHLQRDPKQGPSSNVSVDQLMKLSVLPENTAKCEKAPKLYESSFKTKKEKKEKAAETAGPGWFNLPKAEITPELKKDLQLMRMRNVLDPKQHYKRSDSHAVPKYFQVGTIVEGAHDFYSSRLPNKQRKKTLVDELLADADFRRRNKRKYLEMQKESMKMGKKFKRKKKLKQ